MGQCLASCGITCPDCDNKFAVPGIERDEIWIANKSEVLAFISDTEGEVKDLTFGTYDGLWKICLHKNTGQYTEELVTSNTAGAHYTQTFVGRTIDSSTEVRNRINEYVDTDLVIIFKKKDGTFMIIGEDGGVTLSENVKNTGATTGDETGDLLTFSGLGNGKARNFFDTSEAATQTILDDHVIACK